MNNFIVISNDIQQLKGLGEEYLTDKEGNVIAKFNDGNIIRICVFNGREDTLVLEAA